MDHRRPATLLFLIDVARMQRWIVLLIDSYSCSVGRAVAGVGVWRDRAGGCCPAASRFRRTRWAAVASGCVHVAKLIQTFAWNKIAEAVERFRDRQPRQTRPPYR